MRAIQLKTEYMTDPIGIDIKRPYLSWICKDGIRQTAYEVSAVLTDGTASEIEGIWDSKAEVWNSGKVESNAMYAEFGMELTSRQRILWKVRLWDEDDMVGAWSEAAVFELGLLDKAEFIAKWINPELICDPKTYKPASYLKNTFSVDEVKPARLYITCHGLYEAWINGTRVGEFVLAPGTYNYDKRLAYQTYDVTDLLKSGENEVLVILGDGWYRSCSGVDGDRNLYGEDIALYFQLEMDGKPVCVSDESWEATQDGPIRENDMQQGEVYDARMEKLSGWHEVKVEAFGVDNFCVSNCVPIVEKEIFSGKVFTAPNGETVIDYGQNMGGYVEFTLQAHEGDIIIMTHGESLDENGNFTAENFQDRKRHKEGGTNQRVTYICKEGLNHYKSKFTIWGFRYARVETSIDLVDANFTAVAVYSDMEQTVNFTCSNDMVNKLVENSLWSMKSNFCDVPTDCPTRERAAWTGDMGVFVETGLYLTECYPVIRKWLGECRLAQYEDGKVANIAPKNNVPSYFTQMLAGSVGWGDACIIVPFSMYKRYGDVRILEENYEMMQKWYAFLENRAKQKTEQKEPDLTQLPEEYRSMVEKMPKKQLQQMMQKMMQEQATAQNPYAEYTIDTGIDYGEWCEPDVVSTNAMGKPQSKVATAYFAQSGRILSEISAILGKEQDSIHYKDVAQNAAKAYHFIATRDGEIHSDRQAEYVRAISFDLLSQEEKDKAAKQLNEMIIQNGYHLNTGFLSTPDLCKVLTKYGYLDTAYKLLLQDTMPSWLYAVKKGATTIWETWDGINEKGEVKESLNHYSYGAVCGWLFSDVCGIKLENGQITICPKPHPLLQNAKTSYHSPVGEIISGWHYEGKTIVYEIAIPANANAKVMLADGRKMEIEAGIYRF